MSIRYKKLASPGQLTGTAATYYTCPSTVTNTSRIAFTFTNTDSAARTVTIYVFDSGGTAGVTNILTSAKSLAAGETWTCPDLLLHSLNPGDVVQAFADTTAKVAYHLSGVEMTS